MPVIALLSELSLYGGQLSPYALNPHQRRKKSLQPFRLQLPAVLAHMDYSRELEFNRTEVAPKGQAFEPLLSAEEAARHLRIHVKTLLRLARDGKAPGIKMGKYWRFRLSGLDSWVCQQQNQFSQPFRVK